MMWRSERQGSGRKYLAALFAGLTMTIVFAPTSIASTAPLGAAPGSRPVAPTPEPTAGAPAPGAGRAAAAGALKRSSRTVEADAAQQAKASGKPTVIDSLTTQTQTVTALPSGGFRAVISALPTRVEQDGHWAAVDTTLETSTSGMLAPAVSPTPVEFSPGGDGPLLRVQSDSGEWLEQQSPFGKLPTPIVDGDSAVYPNVLPGVNLHLAATVSGVKQVLEITTPEAAANPALDQVSYPLDSGGALSVADHGSAGAQVQDQSGKGVLHVGTAAWWDSSTAGASADGGTAVGDGTVASSVSTESLSVDVDAAAAKPGVVYPIFVDPTFTTGKSLWAAVDSAYPNQAYFNGAGGPDGWAPAGFVQASWSDDGRAHTKRSMFQMNISPVLGKLVTAAHFDVVNVYSSSCQARAVSLYMVNPAPTASTTWNNQPGIFGGLVDQRTFAHGYNSSCPGAAEGFNAIGAVQTGQAYGFGAITLMLAAANEGDTLTWKKFDPNPTLTMDYNTPPDAGIPTGVIGCNVCSPVAYVRSTYPTLEAGANDSDGDNLRLSFEVGSGWNPPGAGTVAQLQSGVIPSGTRTTVTPGLADGDYAYRVRAQDTAGNFGGWSGWVPFTVDTVAPAAPTVTMRATSGFLDSGVRNMVGDTVWTATISSTAADHARGYIYARGPSGTVAAPPSNMLCGETAGKYTLVCFDNNIGGSLSVPVASVDTASQFTAWTFDAAGNLSNNAIAGPAASVNLTAAFPSPRPKTGHQWAPEIGTHPVAAGICTGTIGDTKADTDPARRALTLGSGACVATGTGTGPATGKPGLQFSGGGIATAAADPAVDTSKSYSVAAWVKPAGLTGTHQTFISQYPVVGAANPAYRATFYLQIDPTGKYRFCVAVGASSGAGARCVTSSTTALANTWVHVVGTYDAANKQIRVAVTGAGGGVATQAVAEEPDALPTARGSISIGNSVQPDNAFTGQVYRPLVAPGVLSGSQISLLTAITPMAINNAVFPGGLASSLLTLDLMRYVWGPSYFAPRADGSTATHITYDQYLTLGVPAVRAVSWIPGSTLCTDGANPNVNIINPDGTEKHLLTAAEKAAAGTHPVTLCP